MVLAKTLAHQFRTEEVRLGFSNFRCCGYSTPAMNHAAVRAVTKPMPSKARIVRGSRIPAPLSQDGHTNSMPAGLVLNVGGGYRAPYLRLVYMLWECTCQTEASCNSTDTPEMGLLFCPWMHRRSRVYMSHWYIVSEGLG